MAEFKLNIGLKNGKTYSMEVKDEQARVFLNHKIGDVIKGDAIGLKGYELKITGGSDKAGFPMRWDVNGTARKRVLIVSGVGIRKNKEKVRKRKLVAGNTVQAHISQINLKVVKEGPEPLFKEEEQSEEKKEEPAQTSEQQEQPSEKEETSKE